MPKTPRPSTLPSNTEHARFGLRPVRPLEGSVLMLTPGENLIGSDPGCAPRLEGRGISRHHARLSLGDRDLEIEDLGSKNGTRVNGRPVERHTIRPGDVLGFADERYVFEALDDEDAEMAVEIDWSTREEPVSRVAATSILTRTDSSAEAIYVELSRFLAALRLPKAAAAEGALSGLIERAGLDGACLAEWPVDGDAHVLAASGHLQPLPRRDAIASARSLAFDPTLGALKLDGAALGVVRRPSAGSETSAGLIFWGRAAPALSPVLLASLLRILEGFRSEEAVMPEHGDDAPLTLPESIAVGPSAAMAALYEHLRMLSRGDVPVLILGETGAGKEHLARALHANGDRRGAFVAVNCAAIPADLLESELFGIGQGVATGVKKRVGKFLEADGGTLFLDEIGDMPPALQAKLLRVLEERRVSPLGESPVDIDIRLVSATHANLEQAIADGGFRPDLYYRLAGYALHVPPLRRRLDDLPVLVGHLLKALGREAGRPVRGVTVKALQRLAEHPWPGNVRELSHVLRRLIYLCPRHQAIDSRLVAEALAPVGGSPAGEAHAFPLGERGLEEHLAEIEGVLIRRALAASQGNRSQAARLLRISRNGLARRLDRLVIDPADFAES